MSKFDTVYKKIEEMLPVTPGQPQPKPAPSAAAAQQPVYDQKIVQELIAAQNEQQVKLALQKLQAVQAAQQKPASGTQPAV